MGRSNRRGGASGHRFKAVAGNGLVDRRALLGRGAALAGAMTAGVGTALTGAAAEPLADQPWSLETGAVTPPLQAPSRFEKHVVRTLSNPDNEFRNSHARTPHHLLDGSVTPNSLHFSINHSGLPDIDPDRHRLAIHGLVKQPMVYTLETLSRYPMVSQMAFLECGGNRAPMFSPGDRAGAARPRVLRRVDRRQALHAA
jgi:sulfane dehydrogenase subunit SoxC